MDNTKESISPYGLASSVIVTTETLHNTTTSTVATKNIVMFDDQRSSLSTTEILMIAIGTSILITTIVIFGVLAICKWRKKSTIGMSRSKANGHDRIINGGLRQPLFGGSKKYTRPEIVITEATSDDRRSSGHCSVLEVYHPKSIIHPPPCTLAILEDLDETELISPAVMENNIGSTVNCHYTRAVTDPRHSGSLIAADKSIGQPGHVSLTDGEAAPEDWEAFRLNRTQSVSSLEHPSYTYSNQSPHGMQPYGIGEHVVIPPLPDEDENFLGPLSYAHASQINTLTATTEGQQ